MYYVYCTAIYPLPTFDISSNCSINIPHLAASVSQKHDLTMALTATVSAHETRSTVKQLYYLITPKPQVLSTLLNASTVIY